MTDVATKAPAKVTYHVSTPLVRITVLGEDRLPRLREDDGLVGRLLAFEREQDIWRAEGGGVTGRGIYIGYFYPDDAARIVKWLRSQGARKEGRR